MPDYRNLSQDEINKIIEEQTQYYKQHPPNVFKPLERFWELVRNFFVQMFTAVWSGFKTIFVDSFKEILSFNIEEFFKVDEKSFDDILKWAIENKMFDTKDAEVLKSYMKKSPALGIFGVLIVSISLMLEYIMTIISASTGTMRQTLNAQFTPNVPNPGDIIRAAFIAPEKTGEVRQAMKRAGYDDKDIDLMFLSMYNTYSESIVRELYLRKVISKEEVFIRMRELGYTDTRIKEIIQTWEVIPPPQDLFTMVAHEAFEPDSIKLMGLDEEFPEEQSEWLEKQGISRYWQMKYWISHWNEPSIEQGFEMLHRGVIGMEELDMLFRTVEIPRYWRDKLTAIAYLPYNRVDVRRMYEMGVLSEQEVVRAYLDLGYDEEHAKKLAEWTIKEYNAQNKELTRQQIETAYKNKIVTRDEAKAMLKKIGYRDQYAEYILTFVDFKEAEELQQAKIDNIGEKYMSNLIDRSEAMRDLNMLNLPSMQTEALLEKWDTKKIHNAKLPSKSDLDKMYLLGIINNQDYYEQMRKLGYSDKYISWYFKMLQKKKEK